MNIKLNDDGQTIYSAHDDFFDIDYCVTYNSGWHYSRGLIVGKCMEDSDYDVTHVAVIIPGCIEPVCAARIESYPYSTMRDVQVFVSDFAYLDDTESRKALQTLLNQVGKHYGFRFLSVAHLLEIREALNVVGNIDVPFYDVRACNSGVVRFSDVLWAWNDATDGKEEFAIIDKDV